MSSLAGWRGPLAPLQPNVLTVIPIIHNVDTEGPLALSRLHQACHWHQKDVESLLSLVEGIVVDDDYTVGGGLVGFKGHGGIRGERFKVLMGSGSVGTSVA